MVGDHPNFAVAQWNLGWGHLHKISIAVIDKSTLKIHNWRNKYAFISLLWKLWSLSFQDIALTNKDDQNNISSTNKSGAYHLFHGPSHLLSVVHKQSHEWILFPDHRATTVQIVKIWNESKPNFRTTRWLIDHNIFLYIKEHS